MKAGVYIRDWGNEGLELGVFIENSNKNLHWFYPYKGYIETDNFIYHFNLEKWIYIGEL